MKSLSLAIFMLFSALCLAQDAEIKNVDSLYKEDHFYAGVTYNILGNQLSDVSQSGFSLGFHLGFIKDMPLNKRRNWAIGLGFGYSSNSFNQNILVSKTDAGDYEYSILSSSETFSKNKFSSHLLEFPLEIRWRTSTPTTYNFWRIYTGFKLGYVFANTTKYKGDLGRLKYSNNPDFNRMQYGLTLSAGYDTWNFHLYYALNPVFGSDAQIDGEAIDMNAIKIGLMFYIL